MKKAYKNCVPLVLLLLIAAGVLVSVNSGYAKIPHSVLFKSLLFPASEEASVVAVQFRLPRIVLALLCGMGLAVSGCIMQTVTGNPLADPGILGINAGAGFAVMLFLTFFPALHIRTMVFQPIFAIAGGLCTTGILYLFAERKGKLNPTYFLLGGAGLTALFSSFMLIMAANMDNSSYQIVARQLAGNMWGTSWYQVRVLLPYPVILLPILFTRINILDILTLGENSALSLGVRVEMERRVLLSASVALTSACVSVSGGIGFVGLVSPHIARKLIGGRHRILMPVSMLFGALLLLSADTVGHAAFQPREIPAGIVIAVLAAPYFLFLLHKRF
ncbi:FecCD family ABC transporter permease [Treponema pedis]|uniref:FecCD family ABC transporter permease n=2 Tax=Treponema pedis TaxID=409322 RepID=UPI0004645F2F|nr:iron ABC transporter permease [Treponema pedis]